MHSFGRLIFIALCTISVCALGYSAIQEFTRSDDKPAFIAVDGDTVRVKQEQRSLNTRLRAVGYDTPEIYSAKCELERRIGIKIRRRIQKAIDAGTFTAETTGKQGAFGRTLAVFKIEGRDVGKELIAEGLAVRYVPGLKPDWCQILISKTDQ
ncbi:MAG: thermonuclease family protein [Hyphomicrobiaceae bacterium]